MHTPALDIVINYLKDLNEGNGANIFYEDYVGAKRELSALKEIIDILNMKNAQYTHDIEDLKLKLRDSDNEILDLKDELEVEIKHSDELLKEINELESK